MRLLHRLAVVAALVAVLVGMIAMPAGAQAPERRFGLVIGLSEYKAGLQPTAGNDAGLIAESLRAAGFDVSGARDLDRDTLTQSIREFLDKVTAAGPQAVSFVYLAGYALQFEGENYILPIDATVCRDHDIQIEAIAISDLRRSLAATPGSVKLLVVDGARLHPFAPVGSPLASGLALVEPDPGMLIAFNASPGSIAPIEKGPYGKFAQSLAEMIGTGGLGLGDLLVRLRLRVHEETNGVVVPWHASKISQPFLFMERTPDSPPPPRVASIAQLESQPIRELLGDKEAYVAALERDTLGGYQDFTGTFPESSLAARVRAFIAVRREAMTWRHTLAIDTPEAYWSYLRRYRQGAHAPAAKRRLARQGAADDPPPAFAAIAYDVLPPPLEEVTYLAQPAILFDGPGFMPPPPIPVSVLPPPPPEFMVLAPPPPPIGAFFLPVPMISYSPTTPWARPPSLVKAPPAPPVQRVTIGDTTIINRMPGGAAAPLGAALPAAVVTRVNSGALTPPSPAPAAPAAVERASLRSAPPAGVAALVASPNARTTATTLDPTGGANSPNPPPTGSTSATAPPAGQTPTPRPRPNHAADASTRTTPARPVLPSPPPGPKPSQVVKRSPPTQAEKRPTPAAKKCVVENGKQVCP